MAQFYFYYDNFLGDRARCVPDPAMPMRLKVHSTTPINTGVWGWVWHNVARVRQGVLRGEYLIWPDGRLAIARDGTCIKINVDVENFASIPLSEQAQSFEFQTMTRTLLDAWDQFPLVEDVSILTNINQLNFGHFMMDLLPNIRHVSNFEFSHFLIPHFLLEKPNRRDLLTRCLDGRGLIPMSQPVRVKNLLLGHSSKGHYDLMWLREKTGLSVPSGRKRYYLQRREGVSRPGNLAETPELLDLLKKFGFEFVDFGTGRETVAAELELIDGPAIIFGAHGANLANCVYLNPPLSFIEVMGSRHISPEFYYYSHRLGFDHHVICCDGYDEAGNMVVDCPALEKILVSIL